MTAQGVPALSADKQKRILAVLIFTQLAIWLDTTVLNVALATLADPVDGLAATPTELEWSISSYTLVFAALLFTGGLLADRYGRRRLLALGLLIFGASSVWAAYSSSPEMLIAARAVMGLGSALTMPATLTIIHNVFDDRSRAMAIAVWSGFSGLAVALGPLLGGLLLEYFWWGSVFLLNAPVAVLGIIGVLAIVPETRDPVKRPFDPAGVVLSTVGLLALVFGIIRGGQLDDYLALEVLGPILAGLALIAAFVVVERRLRVPSFDVRLFADRRFAGASWAVMLTFFGLLGSMFFAIFYLQGVRELSPFESGLVLLPVALGVLIGAPASEPLVRRFGVRAVTCTALTVVAGSFLAYTALDVDTPLIAFDALILLQGLGMGAVMAPTTELIMASLPRERSGGGAAINNAMRQVGGVLGVAVLGSVLFTSYRDRIDSALAGVDAGAGAREAASHSAEATRQLAAEIDAPALVDAANAAYVGAMHVTAICSAAAAFCGVIILARALRPEPAGARSAAPLASVPELHEDVR